VVLLLCVFIIYLTEESIADDQPHAQASPGRQRVVDATALRTGTGIGVRGGG
jgi:hypothetical protein